MGNTSKGGHCESMCPCENCILECSKKNRCNMLIWVLECSRAKVVFSTLARAFWHIFYLNVARAHAGFCAEDRLCSAGTSAGYEPVFYIFCAAAAAAGAARAARVAHCGRWWRPSFCAGQLVSAWLGDWWDLVGFRPRQNLVGTSLGASSELASKPALKCAQCGASLSAVSKGPGPWPWCFLRLLAAAGGYFRPSAGWAASMSRSSPSQIRLQKLITAPSMAASLWPVWEFHVQWCKSDRLPFKAAAL